MTARFVTSLGCRVTTYPAPEHLGSGVMVELSMEDPEDHRRTEVRLSAEEAEMLAAALLAAATR